MKNLFIIGAGGYGREVASYIKKSKNILDKFIFKGFLDKNLAALQGIDCPHKVIGTDAAYKFTEKDEVIIAIGSIEIKKKIVNQLKGCVKFFSFVSSEAFVGNNVELGEGVLICLGAKLLANIKLGDFVSINIDSRIGHDSVVGDFCSIMPNVDIGGECAIGKEVFLGTKANIIPKMKLADNTFVGAGAVVIKEIEESHGTYFGNPARRTF